ncbi:hypothetical protein CEXT_460521 [Caerostris extrusa]|uniref:Uncharacterized protein n=1 Tax=Caerostris extrusa TaxID=172846 RepID=A0AAV4NLJ1_CAEEX|nr:hypothetical protein CEXT_460521 [Caerostris extrusa]
MTFRLRQAHSTELGYHGSRVKELGNGEPALTPNPKTHSSAIIESHRASGSRSGVQHNDEQESGKIEILDDM